MDDQDERRTYRYTRPEPPFPSAADVERFWSYVLVDEPEKCWPWRTLKLGTFWWRDEAGQKQHQTTPRLAFRISRGGIDIEPGLVIAHSCDWPACCNPGHVSDKSQQANSLEMAERGLHPYMKSGLFRYTRKNWWSKGRNGPGEGHANAKLTDGVINAVRVRYAAGGIRQVDLAAEFGISQTHVSRIVRGESWSHLAV